VAEVGWVTLRHAETGGETSVNNVPDVVAWHEARGWSVVVEDDEPDRSVFVPPKPSTDPDAEAAAWVDLVHPELPGGKNRVPNNPAAIEGAFDAGWTYPEPPADAVEEELAQLHPRGGRATKAEREQAVQRAALVAAATDEPPAVETAGSKQDEPAGDGTSEE
jgi:hypothetical protein